MVVPAIATEPGLRHALLRVHRDDDAVGDDEVNRLRPLREKRRDEQRAPQH